MRMFLNVKEMVREVERDLWEMGITVHPQTMQDKQVADNDDYATLEIQAYGYKLISPNVSDIATEVDKIGNLAWAVREASDRVSPHYKNPGEAWKLHSEVWEQFLRDGQFAYTYNERFREQLPQLIRELQVRPETRQAIVTMYDRHQDINNWGGKDRIPCSMYYQFYIRDNRLNLIYTMRSCDFLTHFIHDVYFSIRLLEYVADEIDIQTGQFTHFIGSLHAYKKDMKAKGIF